MQNKVRRVTEEDRQRLPTFSYSRLEVKRNCDMQYDLKYNQKKHADETTLALELGSLCHYCLEQKGKMLKAGGKADYDELTRILEEGTDGAGTDSQGKPTERLAGIRELSKRYFEQWYAKDDASGMDYSEKTAVFLRVLRTEMDDSRESGWEPVYFERPFTFVWNDRAIMTGFIDRIDRKGEDYRTIDYKTSKKVYDKAKLATSLQFGIYALAILSQFHCLPAESVYRFVLIDKMQFALSKGWEARLDLALDKVLDQIEECERTEQWKPSPTPLCHWCPYCQHNPDAKKYKTECRYYSLWTPENKVWSVNQVYEPEKAKATEQRKLWF